MTTPAARKGAAFENVVTNYLRAEVGPQVARQRTSATGDRGDIAGLTDWTLEVKAYADLVRGIREGLADLEHERRLAGTRFGAVIVKRPGKADAAEALFVMRLGDAVAVLRLLGGR